MQLAGFELKKIFFYHKGLMFIILFLLIKPLSLVMLDSPVNQEIQEELTGYTYYMEKIQGEITEETTEYMTTTSKLLTTATAFLQQLNNDYYDGVIDFNEYEKKVQPIRDELKYKKGFDVLYNQYTYVREKPENRYILNTNGWDGLLSNEKLDWIFYLLLFLLITPIFCEEMGSNMEVILLTQRKGGRITANNKVVISILLAGLFTLMNSGVEYIYYMKKYGLKHGDYPLQSLSYFSNSDKSISLFDTFAYVTGLKLIGAVSLAVIIIFLSVYIRRYSLVLLISSALVLLPFYMFSEQSIKYYIPGPLSFLIATGFFRGNEYQTSVVTGESILIFREVPCSILRFFIVAVICICSIMIFLIRKRNTNLWCQRRLL